MEPAELAQLRRRVRRLERRVRMLEHATGTEAPQPLTLPASAASGHVASGTASFLGRSFLVLAGAYLLRALTGNQMIPQAFGAGAGIFYAFLWLALAVRAASHNRLDSAMHAATSALVLMPLLYEASVSFHALPAWLAAIVLVCFAMAGSRLEYSWIATLPACGAAILLIPSTGQAQPFVAALIVMAAAAEYNACRDHAPPERWLLAPAADAGVFLMMYLASHSPASYAPVSQWQVMASQWLLLAAYVASSAWRTLWRGREFAAMEAAQCVIVFALSALPAPVTLLAGAACYVIAWRVTGRNAHVYSTFGLVLIAWSVPVAAVLSILSVSIIRSRWMWHSAAYLSLAAYLSGAAQSAWAVLAGAASGWNVFPPQGWWCIAAAIVCCVLDGGRTRIVSILLTGMAAMLSAAVVTAALTGVSHLQVAPAVLSGLALLLAYTKSRALVYPVMALGAWNIALQGMRGEMFALTISLLSYGLTLILLPRVSARTL